MGEPCEKTCFTSEDLECWVLDNNGFIILSTEELPETPHSFTGRFFGDVRPSLMEHLVIDKIYEKIKITDYQGVCLESKTKKEKSPGNILQTVSSN